MIKNHPDKNIGDESKTKLFQEVNECAKRAKENFQYFVALDSVKSFNPSFQQGAKNTENKYTNKGKDDDEDYDNPESAKNVDVYGDIKKAFSKFIGKVGPFKVYTDVAEHNQYLKGPRIGILLEDDVMQLGFKVAKITQKDVDTFLALLKTHLSQKEFNNGRTYIFEGVTVEGKDLFINWGS